MQHKWRPLGRANMGSRTACWLLLALAAADVLELKVDDELAVQARAEFAKFESADSTSVRVGH